MNPENRRFLLFGLLAGTAALIIVFWPTVYGTLILPVALLLWAFLRLFSSLDQTVYWVLVIGVGFLVTIRGLSIEPAARTEELQPGAHLPASRVAAWRAMIAGCTHSREERLALQKSLTGLLLEGATDEDRDQPGGPQDPDGVLRRMLPDRLLAFFSDDLSGKANRLSTGWKLSIRRVKSWIDRSTRKPPLETYTTIEEILTHLETYLEKPDESTHQSPPVH